MVLIKTYTISLLDNYNKFVNINFIDVLKRVVTNISYIYNKIYNI